MRPDAQPVRLTTARSVGQAMPEKVKEELGNMLRQSVISVVKGPTEWCSGMVAVPKKNGKVRICVDLTDLNRAVKREIHPMKKVDENLAKLRDSKPFTKLDANSGFWQIPLAEDSRPLTAFITPFGTYQFNRLPFGISSAPEIFQRMMSELLGDLEHQGVICHMDVLIHAPDIEKHNELVREVLQRLAKAGLTLNAKCEFSKTFIKFLGHIISEEGLEADPEKTHSVQNFPVLKNVTELQRFNGMVNQLAKFLPHLSDINKPLRDLTRKETVWS